MSNNGNNRTGWKKQRYDQLLTEGNSQTDLHQREQLLQQAELLLVRDEVPIVPLWFFKGITFFDARKIDGIFVTNNMVDEHPIYAIRKKR